MSGAHRSVEQTGRAKAVAGQHLRTSLLLGVPFLPRRPLEVAPPAPSETPDASVEASRGLLLELKERHDRTCPHCTRATAHTRTVFGEGNPCARLMFIGEAPGADEDRTGRPFVGRAGQKLDEIIAAMGLRREDVYIANILKARPPDNRTPLPEEVDGCAPFLAQQIRIIRPRVIVALGGPAAKFLLSSSEGITSLRGQWWSYDDLTIGMSVPVMPTFHPAYLLRNYTPDTRRKVWADMQEVMGKLGEEATKPTVPEGMDAEGPLIERSDRATKGGE